MTTEKNLKTNAFLGILNTIVSMLFPLFIFAYASRILAPEGIGITQLASSVSSYFELFASLGIPLYATREIARLRDTKEEQKINASEIFWMNFLNAILVYCIYIAFIILVYGTNSTRFFIFLIYGTATLSTAIGVEWFYKAEEEFGFITIRNLIFKSLSLFLIITLVKKESDIIIYSLIYVGSTLTYSIVNLIVFIVKVKPKFKKFKILKHLKPALSVFIMSVATTIYCSVDTIMLGYLTGESGEYNVGIYSAAFKITSAIISIITAINSIMLPRLSYYYENNRVEDIKTILNTCYKIVIMFAVPIVIACEIMPDYLIYLVCGEEFIIGSTALRIIAPIILFVGLSNLIGIQIFYSSGNIKKTIISVLGGAGCNIVINSILIPFLGINGAAIGTLIAEFVVVLIQFKIGKELLIFEKFNKDIVKYLISAIIMGLLILGLKIILPVSYIKVLLLLTLIGVCVYFISLLLMRETLIIKFLSIIKNKIKRRKKDEEV